MKKFFLLLLLVIECLGVRLQADAVVIIHGFMSNAESMRYIRKALARTGFTIYMWDYPSRKKYLEHHGADLSATLCQIANERPGETIHFITHSSGALVLRAALNFPECPQEAKMGRAILLAPPNQGSLLARNFCGFWPIEYAMGHKSGWELIHLEPQQFSVFGNFPRTMDVLVIAGTNGNHLFFEGANDGLLAVEETYLNTPFYFRAFPLSHGDLLTNRHVLHCLKAFLLVPEPGHPDPGKIDLLHN